jgi:hypothetical protein
MTRAHRSRQVGAKIKITEQMVEVGERIVFEYVNGSLSAASFSTVAVEVYTAMRLLELEHEERASQEKVADNKSS